MPAAGRRRSTRRSSTVGRDALPRRPRAALRLRVPRRPAPAGRVGEPAGHRRRADRAATAGRAGAARRRRGRAPGPPSVRCSSTTGSRRRSTGARPRAGRRRRPARRSWRSSARRCRCTRASPRPSTGSATCWSEEGALMAVDPVRRSRSSRARWRRSRRRSRRRSARTARSPMIRDAHDFRAGIHDRQSAQAHRPLVLRARAPRRARLPARHHAARRRVLPQRRLPVRGRHRPPARPVRDRAGVRRRGRGPGWSRSSRRSATTTTSGERCPGRCRRTPPRCSRRA